MQGHLRAAKGAERSEILRPTAPATTASKRPWMRPARSELHFENEGPFCGTIFDNYGSSYLFLIGSFMHVFGLMMASISHEYYQFLLSQGVCSALGAGLLFWPTMYCLQTWFSLRRALAIGIAVSGSGLGGVCLPIAVERMIPEIGYAWTMRTCAFIILALCVVINLTVKSRIPPSKRKVSIMSYVRPLTEQTYFFTMFGIFLFGFGLMIPFNYIILNGRRWGMSQRLASYLPAILNSGSIVGRILPGALADKFGRYNVMVIVCYLCAIWTLALWIPANTNALVILYAIFYGICSGGFVSLPAALIAQISDIREIGVRTGTIFFFMSFGALTGNPIAGALVDDPLRSNYWKLQVFAGVMMAAGGTSLLMARISKTGLHLFSVF
ncbi:hypothetical protein KEM56_007652 [Ascosphaera pollenicola]|nr:hypothetical protein KEM56_007652 [Ascosphaera pollenicola]